MVGDGNDGWALGEEEGVGFLHGLSSSMKARKHGTSGSSVIVWDLSELWEWGECFSLAFCTNPGSTESQKSWGWKGPQGWSRLTPPPRAGDTGTQPAGMWVNSEMPQLPGQLLQSCSSALPPPWKKHPCAEVELLVLKLFLCFIYNLTPGSVAGHHAPPPDTPCVIFL